MGCAGVHVAAGCGETLVPREGLPWVWAGTAPGACLQVSVSELSSLFNNKLTDGCTQSVARLLECRQNFLALR